MNYELWQEKTLFQVWPEFIAEKRHEFGEPTQPGNLPLAYYQEYFRRLQPAFRKLRLRDIHITHIIAYQKARLRTAGPGVINHELHTLSQILDKAGLWEWIGQFYEPLIIAKSRHGEAFFPEEALHRKLWQTHLMQANRKG